MGRQIIPDIVADQELAALPPGASAIDAARLMSQRSINAVLIMDDATLLGIFTARDLARRIVAVDRGLDTPLSEVMTKNPQTIGPGAAPVEGLRRMFDGGFRHLPVVDNNAVVGMISRRDLFQEEERLAQG